MPCTKDIQRRIQSVRNTQQITRAMKMISAAKLYRAQKKLLEAKPYSEELKRVFSVLCSLKGARSAAPFAAREIKRTLVIAVTGDRGMAGGFNIALSKLAQREKSDSTVFATVGRKGRDALKQADCTVVREFCGVKDSVSFADTVDISSYVLQGYESGEFDCVKIVYQRYVSSGRQEPAIILLLPVSAEADAEEEPGAGFDPEFGARPVKRALQRLLLNDLSRALLSGSVDKTKPIHVKADGEQLTFSN